MTMAVEIWCAIIPGVVTLLVSIGTWHVTAKKDQMQMEKLFNEKIADLKDDNAQLNAIVQQQMATQTLEITHLRSQVEKHNGVLERMFKLEQRVDDMQSMVS